MQSAAYQEMYCSGQHEWQREGQRDRQREGQRKGQHKGQREEQREGLLVTKHSHRKTGINCNHQAEFGQLLGGFLRKASQSLQPTHGCSWHQQPAMDVTEKGAKS